MKYNALKIDAKAIILFAIIAIVSTTSLIVVNRHSKTIDSIDKQIEDISIEQPYYYV